MNMLSNHLATECKQLKNLHNSTQLDYKIISSRRSNYVNSTPIVLQVDYTFSDRMAQVCSRVQPEVKVAGGSTSTNWGLNNTDSKLEMHIFLLSRGPAQTC